MPGKKKSEDRIILPKEGLNRSDEARAGLAQLDIKRQDVAKAVGWARESARFDP
jgi:hypothetical protein